MTLVINKEAPKVKLVTIGQADKEIEMGKEEVSFETHPDLYHYPSGATEPVLKNPESAGVGVIKQEPASKPGAVGAKGEPKKVARKK